MNREDKKMLLDRTCYVCLKPIPEAGGVFMACLMIIVHDGECHDKVTRLERVKGKSSRGRWRPIKEVLSLLQRDWVR